jgi:hypothetical protein
MHSCCLSIQTHTQRGPPDSKHNGGLVGWLVGLFSNRLLALGLFRQVVVVVVLLLRRGKWCVCVVPPRDYG